MTKDTSRQRILTYLRAHHGVTASEIARALKVTPANIRHHLAILVADRRAQSLGARPDQGRGRPEQLYGLSDVAIGDNLAGLADGLLAQLLENIPAQGLDSVLEVLAARLAPGQPPGRNLHITRRLALTIEQLNALGYAARWEAHASGPRVIFEHCPYAAIIAKHPELCRMDGFLLQKMLGTEITQSAKLETNIRGLPFCMFELGR